MSMVTGMYSQVLFQYSSINAIGSAIRRAGRKSGAAGSSTATVIASPSSSQSSNWGDASNSPNRSVGVKPGAWEFAS